MKLKYLGIFIHPQKMLMAIITLFHAHLSFEKKGFDSDIKWRIRATIGSCGLSFFDAQIVKASL